MDWVNPARVVQLRAAERTLAEIAFNLNEQGIPAPGGRKAVVTVACESSAGDPGR
jgi:hypothetical protein